MFSRMQAMVRQFIRSAMRDCAVWMIGALCPSRSPATTTATTPDAWTSSAATYAANGTRNDMPVSKIGSVTRLRRNATSMNIARPTATPPPAATTKSTPTSKAVMPRPAAAIAVRNATRAVASLSSDSPSRMVTIRRGSPIRRPMVVAATASGGATTAPIASAAGQPTSGSSSWTSQPMPKVVKTTRPTERSRITRRWALKSTSDVCRAAE